MCPTVFSTNWWLKWEGSQWNKQLLHIVKVSKFFGITWISTLITRQTQKHKLFYCYVFYWAHWVNLYNAGRKSKGTLDINNL